MEKRETKITLRLTHDEHDRLRDLAHAARLQLAEFVRSAALGRDIQPAPPVAPQVNREVYADLARLAANFNQVARHLNEGRAIVGNQLARDVIAQILQISEQLATLRAELIGNGEQ